MPQENKYRYRVVAKRKGLIMETDRFSEASLFYKWARGYAAKPGLLNNDTIELYDGDNLRFISKPAELDPKEVERIESITQIAQDQLELGDDLNLDYDEEQNIIISDGDDNGCFVRTWSWVSFSGTNLDKDADET